MFEKQWGFAEASLMEKRRRVDRNKKVEESWFEKVLGMLKRRGIWGLDMNEIRDSTNIERKFQACFDKASHVGVLSFLLLVSPLFQFKREKNMYLIL